VAEQLDQNLISYEIPKATGTHGDIFAAVGLALLLKTAVETEVRIIDTGLGFEVRTAQPSVDSIPPVPGYPFLKTNEKTAVPAGDFDLVDYKTEKAKADRRRKLQRAKRSKAAGAELQQLLQQDEPRADWRLLQVLNTLQGDETTNRVHAQILSMSTAEFRQAVAKALGSLSRFEPSGLDWPATSVQLFAPNAAKGYSRLKPDSTDRNDKTKEQWLDPFVEWLRYRGYFAAACPYFQGDGAEHVRLLCPVPRDIDVDGLRGVVAVLRDISLPAAAPKLDSLAALKLAELLIRYSAEFHDADKPTLIQRMRGRTPADVISAVSVTHYQSLGNAKAVSAISSVALPGWLNLKEPNDASVFLAILGEHQRVIRELRHDHSDEIGLLIQYRRFLETRGDQAIAILIDFMARYGSLVLRGREQGRKIPQFTTANTEKLIMAHDQSLSAVLAEPGFKAVAAAIRTATVNAQAQKAMNRPDYREIRYDLLPDLRRKASLPGNEPLVQAISEFISLYNVENARRRELGKPAPRNVTTEEFESLIRLIETHGAATVGPMLCAYGSCRLAREEEPAETENDLQTVEEGD